MDSRAFELGHQLRDPSADARGSSYDSRHITDAEWEKHKSFITSLQINSTTTTRMLELLQEYRKFTPSESQLQARLAKWQLKVYYNPNPVRNVTATAAPPLFRPPRRPSGDFSTQPSDDGMMNQNAFNEAEARSEVSDPSVAGTRPRYSGSHWTAQQPLSADDYSRYLAQNYDNTNTNTNTNNFRGSTYSQSSTLVTKFSTGRSPMACSVCNSYPIQDRSESNSRLLHQMKIITSSVANAGGFPTCDIFTDAGELLYACRMFSEAQCLFTEAYTQLKRDSTVSYVQLAFAAINCLRAANRPLCCSAFSDSFMPVGAQFVMAQVSKKDRPGDDGNRRSLYYVKLSELLRDSGIYISHQSEGIRAECQRLRPSNREAVTRESFQNCYVLSWRRIGLKDLSYAPQVVNVLADWISDIEDESCHVWRLLRSCLDLLENYCVGSASRTNMADIVDQRSLSTNPDILGCFLVRDYFRGVLSQRLDSQGPLSKDEQLSKFIRYKLDVQTHLLVASWIIDSADPRFGGTDRYAPFMSLRSGIHTILSTSISQRASRFLQLHEEAWYTPIHERRGTNTTPATEMFISQTAVLMAEASVHLIKITQHACTDTTPGRRQRPHSTIVSSQPTTTSKPSFNFADKLRKKLKGKSTNDNTTNQLSNNLHTMTLDPDIYNHSVAGSPPLSSPSSHVNPSHRMTWSHSATPNSPGYNTPSPGHNHRHQHHHSSPGTHFQAPPHPSAAELDASSTPINTPPPHLPHSPLRTWHGAG